MPAFASGDREILVKLVRRMQDRRANAFERAGELAGALVAPFVAVSSALLRARAIPARGDCADADVYVADAVPRQHRALAERLSGSAVVRFSDARPKRKACWPDLLGCAIRFGGGAEDAATSGDQDLLLSTTKRPWTLPLSPFTTKVHDYLANDYFAVSPFSVVPWIRGRDPGSPRFWFRLRPASKEPDGLVTVTSSSGPISSLRASTATSRRSPAEQRSRRFERAIANGSAAFTLGIAESPWGPFAPLVRIQLVSIRLTDPASLHFDPFRCGRGIEPRGFFHALRRATYAARQRT